MIRWQVRQCAKICCLADTDSPWLSLINSCVKKKASELFMTWIKWSRRSGWEIHPSQGILRNTSEIYWIAQVAPTTLVIDAARLTGVQRRQEVQKWQSTSERSIQLIASPSRTYSRPLRAFYIRYGFFSDRKAYSIKLMWQLDVTLKALHLYL